MKTYLALSIAIFFCIPIPGNVGAQERRSHHELDFWTGEWNAYSAASGNIIGQSTVTPILDSSVLLESWTDVRGFQGKSFTLYDKENKCWRQTWVDNTGTVTDQTGHVNGDAAIFTTGPFFSKKNQLEIRQMLILRKSEDELMQMGQSSYNNGTTWDTTFNFIYRRRPSGNLRGKLFTLSLNAVHIRVPDLTEAKRFYHDVLGFPMDARGTRGKTVTMYSNMVRIVIQEDNEVWSGEKVCSGPVLLTLRVNNLDSTYHTLKAGGVTFLSSYEEGAGSSLSISDPFGNPLTLIHPDVIGTFTEPKIYNVSLSVPDIEMARAFYVNNLGFVEHDTSSPGDLPLESADGEFAFTLHQSQSHTARDGRWLMSLLFNTSDISRAYMDLAGMNIPCSWTQDGLSFVDPAGIRSQILRGK